MEPPKFEIAKTAELKINVHLDAQNMPVGVEWHSTDGPDNTPQTAKAFILSLWNKKERIASRIDLWTKDMTIEEMNHFIFQTMMGMSDTFLKATQNKELAGDMRKFGEYFGKKANVLKENKV